MAILDWSSLKKSRFGTRGLGANFQIVWLMFWIVAIVLSFLGDFRVHAAQSGPVFPSHRFPTDQSYHIGYDLSMLSSASNYTGSGVLELPGQGSLLVANHKLTAEFQPNRFLNFGLLFNVEYVKIARGSSGAFDSKTSLGDQRVFAEYRFHDIPGRSAGVAIMAKFPGYKNPTSQELSAADQVALLGDAQSDFTALLTSELWLTRTLRARLDAGATYRTEQYAAEFPFLASLSYVTPKIDFEFRLRGNATLGNDGFSDATIESVQEKFGSSSFAFSQNPWLLVFEPHVEIWLNPRLALITEFSMSLAGNNAPKFFTMTGGLTYRWAETKIRERRTFQEVHIETDQESGDFQGEKNDKFEPRAPNPERILEEPSRGDESSDEQ